MRIVVGLGNPGARYQGTRHNIGFEVVDELARRYGGGWRDKFKALVGEVALAGDKVLLVKPQTFMNLSGETVQPAAQFFGVEPEGVVVVHDELDLPLGRLKVKVGGGHAGHNGLRSMVAELGSRDFVRLRVGIGRPAKGSPSNYVLSDFGADEIPWLPDLLDRAADAVELALREGPQKAMNTVNAA